PAAIPSCESSLGITGRCTSERRRPAQRQGGAASGFAVAVNAVHVGEVALVQRLRIVLVEQVVDLQLPAQRRACLPVAAQVEQTVAGKLLALDLEAAVEGRVVPAAADCLPASADPEGAELAVQVEA